MNITGVKADNSSAQKVTRAQGEDPMIKSLQSQITGLQKQLQQLSKDESGDAQALADKRREIQQQIADLNARIRQRQGEIRQENQVKETPGSKSDGAARQKRQDGFSLTDTADLLAAANTLEQSKAVGGVIARSEGRADILKAEIKTDKSRGADTSYKEKELSKVNKGIETAKETQAKLMAESSESVKAEGTEEKKAKAEVEENEDIRTEGKYNKEGELIEERDPENAEYEDKA
ncbi:MAG TPA: hypothetical protein DDX91_01760 [Ruminococcaceae bacterium]|nr:hypothetical protein [Oscillospiraceae bacterium]